MKAVFKTNRGDFELELWDEHAPNTVENFVKLAKEGFYNDTKFHRVIEGFMIQGGDPLSKDDEQVAYWGTGGPGYQFDCEIHPENKNEIGTISMANAGPNTNGSQFFINTNDNHFLNTKHTVFGKILSGMDTVTDIEQVATNHMDRPMNDVVVELVEVLE
ncbi:peptidylprolyl isomerase [bacterium DOLZORAL124_38_8]|nr:MAG: peptidylprolyl isomerase [bacterium DOLZORAL124_38_8]